MVRRDRTPLLVIALVPAPVGGISLAVVAATLSGGLSTWLWGATVLAIAGLGAVATLGVLGGAAGYPRRPLLATAPIAFTAAIAGVLAIVGALALMISGANGAD